MLKKKKPYGQYEFCHIVAFVRNYVNVKNKNLKTLKKHPFYDIFMKIFILFNKKNVLFSLFKN